MKLDRKLLPPAVGTAIAIAMTSVMDAVGLSVFSALPLFPLAWLFCFREGFDRKVIGLVWGEGRHYRWAVLYPVTVLLTAALIAFASGATDVTQTNWRNFWVNLLLGGSTTVVVSLLTEEGFFRGWLWASLTRAGISRAGTLVASSAAFSLWHVSAVILKTGFELPAMRVPVYLLNVLLIGLIWGMLRQASGSVVVASVSHGLWNGLAYALFAFGTKVGALGVEQTAIFGPEVGVVGLLLNGLFAGLLWRWLRGRDSAS